MCREYADAPQTSNFGRKRRANLTSPDATCSLWLSWCSHEKKVPFEKAHHGNSPLKFNESRVIKSNWSSKNHVHYISTYVWSDFKLKPSSSFEIGRTNWWEDSWAVMTAQLHPCRCSRSCRSTGRAALRNICSPYSPSGHRLAPLTPICFATFTRENTD